MKNIFLIFVLFPIYSQAQLSEQFIEKGLVNVKGTLGIGIPTNYSGNNMYVNANCEYYLEDNISFRGSFWIFLGTAGTADLFSKNHTLYTGFYFHPKTKNNLDPYIGFEPGASWTQLKKPDYLSEESIDYHESNYKESVNPVTSFTIGLNYFATKWTHLFVEAKYNHGIHISGSPPVSLNEFRLAFGFGFNLKTNKKA